MTLKNYGFLFLFLCSLSAVAQVKYQISGHLLDLNDHKPIQFATLSLSDSSGKTTVSNTFSTETGNFVFNNIKPGKYFVNAKLLGYDNLKSDLINLVNANVMLDTLLMVKSSKAIKEVTITGEKPLLEIESDKVTYLVENDITLEGMMALDALKKLPFVTVDENDNIQMKGSSNFKVLLNGKSTSIVARNPSEALKSFPAGLIKKIEVITEPSAKYDAEGTAGIINIITYKKVMGYNGSANITYNSRGMNNGGASINVKMGKLGVSSNFGINTYKYVNQNIRDITRINTIPGFESTLKQHSVSSSDGLWYWGNVELAYDFDTLHTLSVYFAPNGGKNGSTAVQNSDNYDSMNVITESFISNVKGDSKNPSTDIGLDFIKTFKDNEDHELSFSALTEFNKDKTSYTSVQDYLFQSDRDIFNSNSSTNLEHTFNLDYTKPFLKKQELETGAKFIFRDLNSNYRMMERSSPTEEYTENPYRTNSLHYNQNVGALYTTYAFPIKTFKVKLGARVEQTWIDAQFNRDSAGFKSDYTNFIPTASISTKLKKKQSLRLNYSKRIQRPWMTYLNPYVDNQNPKNISFGNPNLVPEQTHSVSFSYNYFFKQNSIDITLSNSFTDNVITSFTTLDSLGVSSTSFYNIAKSNTLGLSIGIWGTFFGKMQVRAGVNSSFVNITHKLDASRNRQGFSNRGHGNVTWNFEKGFSATLGGWVWQGAPTLQSVRPLSYNYNLSVRKSFLKKKLNLGFVANNFLQSKQSLTTISRDPNFYSESVFTNTFFRYFSLNVNYSFGKLRENVSRKKGISNDDIKGGDN